MGRPKVEPAQTGTKAATAPFGVAPRDQPLPARSPYPTRVVESLAAGRPQAHLRHKGQYTPKKNSILYAILYGLLL